MLGLVPSGGIMGESSLLPFPASWGCLYFLALGPLHPHQWPWLLSFSLTYKGPCLYLGPTLISQDTLPSQRELICSITSFCNHYSQVSRIRIRTWTFLGAIILLTTGIVLPRKILPSGWKFWVGENSEMRFCQVVYLLIYFSMLKSFSVPTAR